MDKGHKIVLACCATLALMLVSCASEELLGEAAGTGRAIAFEVGVAGSIDITTTRSGADDFLPTSSLELHGGDSTFYANCDERNTIDMHYNTTSATTRGSIQTSDAFYDRFGLYGYVYDSGSTWESNKTSLSPDGKINDLQVSKADGTWKTNVYWPGSTKKATFFAYAPYRDTNASITTNGTPSVTYTVPSTISAQQDLLIAKSTEDILCDGKTQPSLTFDHALTAVTFKQGNLPTGYSIKSIEISGVYNKGELSFEGTEWTGLSTVEGNTYTTTSLSDVLFLMPQIIPSGAKLKVTFTDGSTDYPFEADLSDNEWKKGYKYIYSLSVNKVTGTYELDVTPTSPVSAGENGGSVEYTVKSYYKWDDDRTKGIGWTASFSTNNGSTWSSTAPSWLTGFTSSGNGSSTGESYTARVSSRSVEKTSTEVLKSAPEVSDYDLSLHTVSGESCKMTTANCYLVHAAGTYKLPLVYGNAIKGGQTNIVAYDPTGTSDTYFLKPFVNHADAGITDPWLKNNGANPDGAKLIWQDVKGLIEKVDISGDYLTFTVSSAKIAEGNAVIAATKSGTVVWSWHIWVTPETLSTLTPIQGNEYEYKVTPVNLGWVNSGNITLVDNTTRSCTVKITQTGGSEKTFVVTQNPSQAPKYTASKQGVNTYYQWGRKDPEIPAAAYNTTSNHVVYNISGGNVSPTNRQSSVTIGTAILYPLIHYCNTSDYGPYSTSQYNLWDANNTATGQIKTKTVKTIYDPCPSGFCIPTSDLWYKMSGNSASSSSNGSWDNMNLGRLWTDNTPNVFFPASGLRSYSNGSLSSVGSGGYFWSASPNSSKGHSLYLNSGYWYWNYSYRAYGFPVRAVLEE